VISWGDDFIWGNLGMEQFFVWRRDVFSMEGDVDSLGLFENRLETK